MHSIPEIIEDIRNGKMVILVDDESRENEGDLILAADFVTPDAINFMISQAKGLVCLAMSSEQINRLQLPQMVGEVNNQSPNRTAFTVSIEAAKGISTGISAADRAHTIRVAANPKATPQDIIMPGHIFPIKAQPGGVLNRAGHTEASVDLSILAGLNPAAVICEIMKADGTMARVSDLKEFAKNHDIKIGTIEDLIAHRMLNETLIEKVFESRESDLPDFKVIGFKSLVDGSEALVLQKGVVAPGQPVPVRVQTENSLLDFIKPELNGKKSLAQSALNFIKQNEVGIFINLLKPQLNKSDLPTKNESTKMDPREYGFGAQVLRALGALKIKLITNKPSKRVGLSGFGIEIVEIISLNQDNKNQDSKLNHLETEDNLLQ